MTRSTMRVSGALVVLAAVLGGGAAGEAVADGNGKGPPMERDECVYTAHGSRAAEHQNANANGHGGGSGGGPKTATCSKTFAKWTKSSLAIWVDGTGAPASVGSTTFETYVHDAFTEWACHSGLGATVTLSYLGSAAGADITVGWGDLGTTGILGQTSTSYSGGVIAHSDVTMNENGGAFSWTVGSDPGVGCEVEAANGVTTGNDYDLLSVLTHEIGHALGVSHPTNRCSSRESCYPETMYSCTASEEWMRRALNPGDIHSISSLYGP